MQRFAGLKDPCFHRNKVYLCADSVARKIPLMRTPSTGYRLGLAMFLALPVLAGLKSIKLPANITLLVPALLIAALASSRAWSRLPRISTSDYSLLILCAWMLLCTAINSNILANLPLDYALHLLSLTVLCPLAYYCGRVATNSVTMQEGASLLKLNIAVVAAFMTFKLLLPSFVASNLGETGSYYQYMGDGLALAGMMAFGLGYRPRLYWSYFLALALLLAIGSRASALAFMTGLLVTNRRVLLLFVATAVPTALLLTLMVDRGIGGEIFGQFRVLSTVLSLYVDDTVDLSLLERQDFLANALQVITQHPLMGIFAYEARAGSLGEYAHNILHMWANFGLPGITLMLLVLVGAPLEHLIQKQRGTQIAATFNPRPLFVFCAAELLFFRHPENLVIFYALGTMTSLYDAPTAINSLRRRFQINRNPKIDATTNQEARA